MHAGVALLSLTIVLITFMWVGLIMVIIKLTERWW